MSEEMRHKLKFALQAMFLLPLLALAFVVGVVAGAVERVIRAMLDGGKGHE